MKKLDLNKSVYELVKEYPEVAQIMAELGFKEITKKAMLNSVAKFMTIPKGAAMKGIDLEKIVKAFEENGFEVEGYEPAEEKSVAATSNGGDDSVQGESNTEKLKSYLKRLNDGEDLESVRADFVKNFSEVDPSEIMKAEQDMLSSGEPLENVQKLCDVHSALFHGATREEKIANAEKAAVESMKQQQSSYDDKSAAAARLTVISGHPLNTLTKENKNLSRLIEKIREEIKKGADVSETLDKIREVTIHYAKKGDLLYPLLKVRYGISGPSDVMWTVDDEIRDELSSLSKDTDRGEEWNKRLEAVVQRADEMIYKETNILFPICAVNFTDDEWKGIYRDSKDYADCLGVEKTVWNEAEGYEKKLPGFDGEVVMPGGHMTVEQLTALLNTIPLEISFVDDRNINRFFNEGPKAFKRPEAAIDREVFTCHPPKVEPMVRQIISDFREGKRDVVPVWMEKNGRTMLVRYMAVRDKNGKYVGTLEAVEDMEGAKAHFSKE